MRKRVFIVQILILVITTFLMLGSVTYAWFSKFEKTSIIEIDTASLKVDVQFYYAGNSPDNNYLLQEDAINITTVIPGDTFYFKFVVTNNGTIPGGLLIETGIITSSELSVFKLKIDGITRDFNELGNIMFESELEKNETKEFYFQIFVTGELTHIEIMGKTMKIESIKIKLDQKQN